MFETFEAIARFVGSARVTNILLWLALRTLVEIRNELRRR
jgi:hypothetical protein